MTPDARMTAYRAELVKLHGEAYAAATSVKYRRGRFLIHLPPRMTVIDEPDTEQHVLILANVMVSQDDARRLWREHQA